MRKEDWVAQMCKPLETIGPLPLETPEGDVIDENEYWITFRSPKGEESDDLTATQTREVIEEEYVADSDDPENSRVRTVRYSESRRMPLLMKAVEMRLIVDARLPKRKKDGTMGVYEWSKNNADNMQFLRKQNQWYLIVLWGMVMNYVVAPELQALVMPEGEGSAEASDVSTSESTETEGSEEI
jgi:hypothetical protein